MAETAAPARPAKVEPGAGYDQDFFLWTERQAALIRAGRLGAVDGRTWPRRSRAWASVTSGNWATGSRC